jgi:hypothetical protein
MQVKRRMDLKLENGLTNCQPGEGQLTGTCRISFTQICINGVWVKKVKF